jgi:hypothetical protein
MALNFPNPSRSFSAAGNRVQFWGYDGPREVSFFVEGDAIQSAPADAGDAEERILNAFDAGRKRIYEVADRVYARSRRGSSFLVLAASDF